MAYQIPRKDMTMAAPMSFGQHWEVRIFCPISFVDTDPGAAFHQAITSLTLGDLLNVLAFDTPGESGKLREVASFRVTEKSERNIKAVRINEIFEVPLENPAAKVDGIVALDIVPSGNGFEVRDRIGNVLEHFIDLEQAEKFRDLEQRHTGVVGFTVKKGFGKWFVCSADGSIAAEFVSKSDADLWAISGGQTAAA